MVCGMVRNFDYHNETNITWQRTAFIVTIQTKLSFEIWKIKSKFLKMLYYSNSPVACYNYY